MNPYFFGLRFPELTTYFFYLIHQLIDFAYWTRLVIYLLKNFFHLWLNLGIDSFFLDHLNLYLSFFDYYLIHRKSFLFVLFVLYMI